MTSVIAACANYIENIVSNPNIGGMKALLLDAQTTQAVSMVYTQTQLLEKEIFLVERIGKAHEPMRHLKAIIFLQPTEENLRAIKTELKSPKFSEYHIFFSNICPMDYVTRLGRMDEHEVVRQVQEYYADYVAVNDDLFHLGIDRSLILSSPSARTPDGEKIFNRNVSGVLALLLSLKKKPAQIRYQSSSDAARRIANDINTKLGKDDIFYFPGQGPLLLILDRRDDPITPLLTQWTYQAMVHELLGINNNRVSLKNAKGVSKDLEEIVLSTGQDKFFATNRNANFGDLGIAINEIVDDYKRSAKLNDNISSIEDMKAFLDRYPAFKSQSHNVSKHVALMGELARLTDHYKLLDISALEQDIACGTDHGGHYRQLISTLQDTKVQASEKLRLSILFLLRYESYGDISKIKSKLHEVGLSGMQTIILDHAIDYAGEARRTPGLFSDGGFLAKMAKQVKRGLEGVENVYTQHLPLLSQHLDNVTKGKLNTNNYPIAAAKGGPSSAYTPIKPKEIIIFIVGGATYEEATAVSAFNNANQAQGMKVILGGSCIHNSTSFKGEIGRSFGGI